MTYSAADANLKVSGKPHEKGGNCWARSYMCQRCGRGERCDVCHKHDRPRGSCPDCPHCPGCAA